MLDIKHVEQHTRVDDDDIGNRRLPHLSLQLLQPGSGVSLPLFRSWMELHKTIEYPSRQQVAHRTLSDELRTVRNIRKAYETAGASPWTPIAEHYVRHCILRQCVQKGGIVAADEYTEVSLPCDTRKPADARQTTTTKLIMNHTQYAIPSTSGAHIPFETVVEEVFHRYGRNWKPRTVAVNRSYLRNQIMPWFRGRPIADITRREVQCWFAALHATPAAANRSLPILSSILRQAELYGHRPENSNPCTGLRRYRCRGWERFLTASETRRLGAALAMHEPTAPLPAAVIRLLLLTGCRQGEIRTLQWWDCREGHLFLRDSRTGPCTV